ncbi:hypothetical protein BGW39_005057 [Mortierella sp. 14UC]|nr:hypothetical protein BGW39_005057 [Mortierella sp. 14UC]
MLMLNISSAAKLVAMTVAGFILASTTATAAPFLNLHYEGDTLPAIDCVKIQGTDINRASLLQGEQLPVKIDTSGCVPSLVDATQPWTLTLVNCQNHTDTLKLADLEGRGADQKEYNWAVQTQLNNILNDNTNTASITDNTNKYYIQVDTPSKDGSGRLTGKTASFTIDTNNSLQKRDDDVPAVTKIPDAPVAPVVNGVTVPDAPAVDGVTVPDTPATDVVTTPEEPTDVNNTQDISPADTTPAAPAAPVIKVSGAPSVANPVVPAVPNTPAAPATKPVIPAVPVPPVVPNASIVPPPAAPAVPVPAPAPAIPPAAPAPAVIPSPTYPNIPLEIVNLATLPNPAGPNQPAAGDPKGFQIILEPKKGPSTGEVFLKYAGAGSAILSTIGLGLGGLVGVLLVVLRA